MMLALSIVAVALALGIGGMVFLIVYINRLLDSAWTDGEEEWP